jgi:hypothetical protein
MLVRAAAAAPRSVLWALAALNKLRQSLLQCCMMTRRQGAGRSSREVAPLLSMLRSDKLSVLLCAAAADWLF